MSGLDNLTVADMFLTEPSSHTDTRSMEIQINVTSLCYECDRNVIGFGDGQRPLCPRRATIFVTALAYSKTNALLNRGT